MVSNTITKLIAGLSRLRPFVVIAPWEQGVRLRLGKQFKCLDNGAHFVIPFVDRVYIQNTQRRATNLPVQTVVTRDGVTLTVAGAIAYRIVDLIRLYHSLFNLEDFLIENAQAVIARIIVSSDASELNPLLLAERTCVVLTDSSERLGLADIEVFISDYARIRTYRVFFDNQYGGGTHSSTVELEKLR